MAFSDNGMVIALAGDNGTYVRIFEWSDANSDWTQRGGDFYITGGFWQSMALSADGAILAMYADNDWGTVKPLPLGRRLVAKTRRGWSRLVLLRNRPLWICGWQS